MASTPSSPLWIYATGLAYSSTCNAKPVPINKWTRAKRLVTNDPWGLLSSSDEANAFAPLHSGSVLILSNSPEFDALRWTAFSPDWVNFYYTLILRNSLTQEEIRIVDWATFFYPLYATNPILVAPFCFNQIEVIISLPPFSAIY